MPKKTAVPTSSYPRPGSHAERILVYVTANDGTTTNGIISGLKLNPSIVRKCLAVLMERGLLRDNPDENRHHHYSAAKAPVN
jgi:hypothetical protein